MRGASHKQACNQCSPGTWSNATGSSAQSECNKCPRGTYSEEKGATSEATCSACKIGTYQPELGQANESVCISCAPGNYSVAAGVSACASCPPGTWSGDFEATACNLCPQGKWVKAVGSLREDQCSPCAGDCLVDKSVRVTIEFLHLDAAGLSAKQSSKLRTVLAHDVASASDVGNASVADLSGATASVTLGPGGRVAAFVLNVSGLTAHDLAARLYSSSFRDTLGNATEAIVGKAAGARVASVALEPEAFVPVPATTTTTSAAPSHTDAPGASGKRHREMAPTHSGASALGGGMSLLMLVLTAVL